MIKLWSCALAGVVLLSGCGATSAVPVAAQAPGAEAQARRLLDKIAPYAFWHDRDQRPYVHFDVTSITGKAMKETDVTVSTDGGKHGMISKLLLARDGGLYIKVPTKTPRVYTFHRVGSYKSVKALASGGSLKVDLVAGAKFKSKRGLPVPMLDYSYVLLLLPKLPAAEKAEPAWAKL